MPPKAAKRKAAAASAKSPKKAKPVQEKRSTSGNRRWTANGPEEEDGQMTDRVDRHSKLQETEPGVEDREARPSNMGMGLIGLDRDTAPVIEAVIAKAKGKTTGGRGNKAYSKKLDAAAVPVIEPIVAKATGKTTGDKGNKAYSKKLDAAAATSLSLQGLMTSSDWINNLVPELSHGIGIEIESNLQREYTDKAQVFPPRDLIFNAFNLTPLNKIKVVILGQDPYHDDGQAHGLSFSVPVGIKIPPSLKNIYKELERSIPDFKAPGHGCLEKWAQRGVFLLNATLTVRAHEPNSHAKFGWQKFTDQVIKVISGSCDKVVFVLWGGFAHKKEKLIDASKHVIIKNAHPSPLSASKYAACNCFFDVNQALKKAGKAPIDWSL